VSEWNILFVAILPLQSLPGAPNLPGWTSFIERALSAMYGLAVRGYLLFIVIGLILFMTGLDDGLSKALIVFGVIIYIGGPYLVSFFAEMARVESPTIESATVAWLGLFGGTGSEMITMMVFLGDILFSICLLSGVVLYLTPSSNDLKAKGHSLMVRALMLAPVLVFLNVTPWI
jgi:hypothetical protein